MTSPTTAKITISLIGRVVSVDEGLDENCEYATMTLYLAWYKDRWTVDKHECSSWFTNSRGEQDRLLRLIANIDELPTDKIPGEKKP
jgi:hypothetical protein